MKMTIENMWVVQHAQPNCKPTYFAGLCSDKIDVHQTSIFEPLSERTKTYSSKRGAEQAARIANEHYESPFISALYIEHEEFEVEEKAPLQSNAKSDELPQLLRVSENDRSGWVMLDRLCGKYPAMLRKKRGDTFFYAVADSETEIRALPADERLAWKRYFAECAKFVDEKIVRRRIAEGKDPSGADEWRKESG